jgi:hypothetical protein
VPQIVKAASVLVIGPSVTRQPSGNSSEKVGTRAALASVPSFQKQASV